MQGDDTFSWEREILLNTECPKGGKDVSCRGVSNQQIWQTWDIEVHDQVVHNPHVTIQQPTGKCSYSHSYGESKLHCSTSSR